MTAAIRFCLHDREISAEPFHYKMSGLDDVYLLNGFKVHSTSYGRGVSVEKADELHQAIGSYLIRHRKVLSPKDFKFLRKTMKLTQDELADCLGLTSQTVARYEKGQTEIPGPADKLTRFLFAFSLVSEGERAKIMREIMDVTRELQDVDETVDAPVYFGATASGDWDRADPFPVKSLAAAEAMGKI